MADKSGSKAMSDAREYLSLVKAKAAEALIARAEETIKPHKGIGEALAFLKDAEALLSP